MKYLIAIATAILFVFMSLAPSAAQQTEKRIALVIGNSAYPSGALATAANDAGLIAQTLQAAGFDVMGARDVDAATLRSSFEDFLNKASAYGPDTVAMVYFAGYGLQFEGDNYLVPIDAQIAHDTDVPLQAFRVSDFLKPLAALPLKARIVVLDAARTNTFGDPSRPLAGGLAEMQPDPGTLIAFNAAPGTVAPEGKGAYGAYATALSEMIKEGGLPLNELFDRVRLRVNQITDGAELPWQASRGEVPFLFFKLSAGAPSNDAAQFDALKTRPIDDFGAKEAYLAAITRDTMRGYLDFLAAYPHDRLARRVRAILAARREAMTWYRSAAVDTPDAYWSYLRRYPHGPHAWDARRRLDYFAAAIEPPPSFVPIDYGFPPPPPEEDVYIDRPVIWFGNPVYDLPPPPVVPVVFLPPRPVYFEDLPPPPPPVEEYVLPVPIYFPVPRWVERPAYVAPPPINIINVNIHNKVVINEVSQTAVVTNPAGQEVPPLPANIALPQQQHRDDGASIDHPRAMQVHPASAAIAAAAVTLPAAVLRARQSRQHQSPVSPERSVAPFRTREQGRPAPLPGMANPSPSRLDSKSAEPGRQQTATVPGALPLPAPTEKRPAASNPRASTPARAVTPPAHATLPLPHHGQSANPQAGSDHSNSRPATVDSNAGRARAKQIPTVPGAHALPAPDMSPATGRREQRPPAPARRPAARLAQPQPRPGKPVQATHSADRNGRAESHAGPLPAAGNRRDEGRSAPQTIRRQQQQQEQAAQQRAEQAARQRATQQAAQARARQATQQRAAEARAQQRAAQQASQSRARVAAQQRAAAETRARQTAEQSARRRAAPQRGHPKPAACGEPGRPPCH